MNLFEKILDQLNERRRVRPGAEQAKGCKTFHHQV